MRGNKKKGHLLLIFSLVNMLLFLNLVHWKVNFLGLILVFWLCMCVNL